jgi:hypothetical protein
MKFEWEQFFNKSGDSLCCITARAKVTGGWILLNRTNGVVKSHQTHNLSISASESMVFISDPEHKWEIDKD